MVLEFSALGTDNKAGVIDIRFISLKNPFGSHNPTLDTGDLLTLSQNFANIGVNMIF